MNRNDHKVKILSRNAIRKKFNNSTNICTKKLFGVKSYKRKNIFIVMYDYLQRNNYDKFFKYNIKRKYRLEDIICEIYYMLRNVVSYENHIGEINGKTLNRYILWFDRNRIFQKVHEIVLNKHIKKFPSDNKTISLDSCNASNKKCTNGINYNGPFKKYSNIDKSKVLKRHSLLKHTKFPKKKLPKKEYAKYNKSLILGKNRHYNNKYSIKISAITNNSMIPLNVKLYNAAITDSEIGYDQLMQFNNFTKSTYLLADKGYSCNNIDTICTKLKLTQIIPFNKRNTKNKKIINSKKLNKLQLSIYKKRVKVENFFAILKNYKRIDHIYEKNITTYEALLHFALIDIILKY